MPKKQLLIDSVVNRFDIPKVYLRYIKGAGPYDYEVADGQQRLTAIWEFVDGDFPLGNVQGESRQWNGKAFSELSTQEQSHILSFELIVTSVYHATNDEVRELFARLQKGERLTPPELRNSMASTLGDVIRGMAQSHQFFELGLFSESRYKRDDLVAHAFAIELYAGSRDLKAPDLARMYDEHKTEINPRIIGRVNEVLRYMKKMQYEFPNCIKTKWGFVDLFWLVSKHSGRLCSPRELAERFFKFEQARLKHTKNPSALIAASNPRPDKDLFDYIAAFSVGGATKENLLIRQRILVQKLV
jgi:hypothetical protein